jgi:cellulose synthase/poly-beta-1,6-N-acetylglucosamine synthase-like glycosyltransferase
MMFLIYSFSLILLLAYVILVFWCIYTWRKNKSKSLDPQCHSTTGDEMKSVTNPFVSVVLATRNEADNILNSLNSFKNQDYPYFEIIVVDDDSTDNTLEITKDFIQDNPGLKISVLQAEMLLDRQDFKKQAINKGILASKGDLILLTDADCIMGDKWISSMVAEIQSHNAKMIVGPVVIKGKKSFFHHFQEIEFVSLAGVTGATLLGGIPLMCNGANLLYRKSAFNEVNGFEGNEKPTGDDVFLMMKFAKRFGNKSISYSENVNSMVVTKPMDTLAGFYHQRKRWASKSAAYGGVKVAGIAGIVYLYCFSMILFMLLSIFSSKFALLFGLLLLVKVFTDYMFFKSIASFFGIPAKFLELFPVQLIYAFYVIITGIFAGAGTYQWKDRTLN